MRLHSSRRGMAFIEVIVVVAILAIIASLMMPVYASARRRARQARCAASLHQLGTALTLYHSDYDGGWPSGGRAGDCAHSDVAMVVAASRSMARLPATFDRDGAAAAAGCVGWIRIGVRFVMVIEANVRRRRPASGFTGRGRAARRTGESPQSGKNE